MWEWFIILILGFLSVQLDNILTGLAREEKGHNFYLFFFFFFFFPFLNSRASSTCLGMSQQNQFSSSIYND